MRTFQKFLVVLFLMVSAVVPMANTYAQHITVEIGDRGYYTHGPEYRRYGHRWVWVPGHWNRYHTHWIHGHYRRI